MHNVFVQPVQSSGKRGVGEAAWSQTVASAQRYAQEQGNLAYAHGPEACTRTARLGGYGLGFRVFFVLFRKTNQPAQGAWVVRFACVQRS